MVAALAATLWGRPFLFPTEAPPAPSDTVRTQLDPPVDEAIKDYRLGSMAPDPTGMVAAP